MFLMTLVGLVLMLSGTGARAAQAGEPGFWKGSYKIFQYNFLYGTGVEERSFVSRSMQLWEYDYDLYQNSEGVAREQLTHMNRNRFVEGPLDIRLLDYGRNEGLVFDKAGDQEIKGPVVPSGSVQEIGTRRILGFLCQGEEYRWRNFQDAQVQVERWRAQNSSLRVPVLEVQYYTDATGALLSMRVQVITEIEPAAQLPASLFQPPSGLKVVEVPDIE